MSEREGLAPHDLFVHLQTWWELHEDFGFSWLISDDQVALNWLAGRIAEAVKHSDQYQGVPVAHFIDIRSADPMDFFRLLSEVHERCLFWLEPPQAAIETWVTRLNEQRQRLIHKPHLYLFCLPSGQEALVTVRAPDLWSVRSWAYLVQSKHYRPLDDLLEQITQQLRDSEESNQRTTPQIALWKQSYQRWQESSDSARKKFSIVLARRASVDAKRLNRYALASDILQQAINVCDSDLEMYGVVQKADCLDDLGDLKSRLGEVNEAQSLYTQAIGLYEQEENNLGRAHALRSLGDLKSRLGEVNEAQSLYEQAKNLYQGVSFDQGVTWCNDGLASIECDATKNSLSLDIV
jgi:tetratricopeptide (TPR) repeat protein